MIDFHCHLDLYPEPKSVVRSCVEREIYVLSVTTTPSAWLGTSALAAGAERIRTAVGLHPQLAHERRGELPLFEKIVSSTRYVGEVGLDGSPDFASHWQAQHWVFERVLDVCRAAGGRILSIHSRRAAGPVLDLMGRCPGLGVGVLHWFSGSQRELDRAIALGCWFSVGPAMLGSAKGRALAERMPRERVLTESDGPFAAVAGRAALPWDADQAAASLSEIWKLGPVATADLLGANLRRLVGGAGIVPPD